MSTLIRWYDDLCAGAYARARRLAPTARNSQYRYAERLRANLHRQGRWLDLGCGHDFLPEWMAAEARQLPVSAWHTVGVDMDQSSIRRHRLLNGRVLGNIEQLPFRADTFDLVTANMVVEHVEQPVRLFEEVRRVLAPGGTLLIHTPNVHGYTTVLTRLIPERLLAPAAGLLLRRHKEDIYPTYYRANSREDLTSAARAVGLHLDALDYVDSSPQLIRVPPLMLMEILFMRAMRAPRLAARRACILATFRKA